MSTSDTHYEDVSLLNFFLDRDVIPIEISFERDMTRSDLQELFESIKSKIGSPKNYGLTKEEQEEIQQLKQEIAKQEAAEKAEAKKKKIQEELYEKEKQIQEWVRKIQKFLQTRFVI